MLQIAAGIFLILHGLVHLLWFVVPWKLMEVDGLLYSTTILVGRIDLGDAGIRVVGLLWVLGMVAFVAAGIGLLFSAPWGWTAAAGAALYSLFLCILGWPDSRYAVLINIAILAGFWIANQ